jgi:tRNA-specific 2-thiouridylase
MIKEITKAVCLLSGGLDSALAANLVQEQGVVVVAVNFILPFGRRGKSSAAEAVAEGLGMELLAIELGEDYLEMLKHPRYGYGSNMNPCIDCHIYMLRKAKQVMEERRAHFIVTGEVVGQRPMSQRRETLKLIERQSGLEGLILRPLSAQLMDPSIPEREGWVRREDLLAISGRSRKEILRLAKSRGIKGYATPAGGCLLTDPRSALRVRDLIEHAMLTVREAARLSIGRHFRLPGGSKLIVGRNQEDNDALLATADESDTLLTTPDCPGPVGVLIGTDSSQEEDLASRIVARYSDGRLSGRVKIHIRSASSDRADEVPPLDAEDVGRLIL